MGESKLGSGTIVDAYQIATVFDPVPNDTRVRLQLDLTASPAGWIISSIQTTLNNMGVPGVQVWSASPNINVSWIHNATSVSGQISAIPVVAIVAAIIAIVVAVVVVIGWSAWQDVPSIIKGPLLTAGIIAAIILAVSIAYRNIRQKY